MLIEFWVGVYVYNIFISPHGHSVYIYIYIFAIIINNIIWFRISVWIFYFRIKKSMLCRLSTGVVDLNKCYLNLPSIQAELWVVTFLKVYRLNLKVFIFNNLLVHILNWLTTMKENGIDCFVRILRSIELLVLTKCDLVQSVFVIIPW